MERRNLSTGDNPLPPFSLEPLMKSCMLPNGMKSITWTVGEYQWHSQFVWWARWSEESLSRVRWPDCTGRAFNTKTDVAAGGPLSQFWHFDGPLQVRWAFTHYQQTDTIWTTCFTKTGSLSTAHGSSEAQAVFESYFVRPPTTNNQKSLDI